jgi:hypothetical protein
MHQLFSLYYIAEALIALTLEDLCSGLQFDEFNTFAGIAERHELLQNLGHVLKNRQDYFDQEGVQRPGNMMGKFVTLIKYQIDINLHY